jgi:hypothetical protein
LKGALLREECAGERKTTHRFDEATNCVVDVEPLRKAKVRSQRESSKIITLFY